MDRQPEPSWSLRKSSKWSEDQADPPHGCASAPAAQKECACQVIIDNATKALISNGSIARRVQTTGNFFAACRWPWQHADVQDGDNAFERTASLTGCQEPRRARSPGVMGCSGSFFGGSASASICVICGPCNPSTADADLRRRRLSWRECGRCTDECSLWVKAVGPPRR